MRPIGFLFLIALSSLFSGAHAQPLPGLTPGQAIKIEPGIHSGEVTTAVYYMLETTRGGILDVVASPQTGEVDLALTHHSGSPSAESRREGLVDERISLRVEEGDRFLIRVSSPLRISSTYKLMISLAGGESSSVIASPASNIFVPDSVSTGATRDEAVSLAVGRLIPIEALGERYFKVDVPAGYLAVLTAYPVFGDVDVAAEFTADGFSRTAISRRKGNLVEQVYVPVERAGSVFVKVTPTKGDGEADELSRLRRYALVVRLRHKGLTENQSEAPDDLAALRHLFPRESLGTGVPSNVMGPARREDDAGAKMILRLR